MPCCRTVTCGTRTKYSDLCPSYPANVCFQCFVRARRQLACLPRETSLGDGRNQRNDRYKQDSILCSFGQCVGLLESAVAMAQARFFSFGIENICWHGIRLAVRRRAVPLENCNAFWSLARPHHRQCQFDEFGVKLSQSFRSSLWDSAGRCLRPLGVGPRKYFIESNCMHRRNYLACTLTF